MDAGANRKRLEVHEEEGLANSQLKLGANPKNAEAVKPGERASLKMGGRPILQTAAR